ncbi:MAG: hypothetical protein K0S45_4163 [Nitrospira sp.]|jgi:hypothetical protein|nr:hypothetical protein [Nitrospira sp.]
MNQQDAQKGRPARPQQCEGARRGILTRPTLSLPRQALFPWRYVEGLSDARTTLEGFFSILPNCEAMP